MEIEKKDELESLRDLDEIRKSVTETSTEEEIKKCVREEIDRELANLSEQYNISRQERDDKFLEISRIFSFDFHFYWIYKAL